jgi:ankyrin repeat protein
LSNHADATALLIDFGANMNCTNNAGNTPLHVAAARNAVDCARWLLIRGAKMNICNKSGQTVSQVATTSASTEVIDLISKFSPEFIGEFMEHNLIVR